MKFRRRMLAVAASALGLVAMVGTAPAQAASVTPGYSPLPQIMYQLPADQPCLKGRANCAIYAKAAQLPGGNLVASFEQSTVPASGSANGQTIPVYSSDDDGTSWSLLSQVEAPAYLGGGSQYTSAWTNPYLYVLPQTVGDLKAGTLLMAAVVSGNDYYYLEQKAANPDWVPTSDGDRANVAIALYSSTTDGASWNFLNIITTGGWQGGSAGAIGVDVSTANTAGQVDPVWEPYLMVYDGQLVAYYSDEGGYLGYNASTGVLLPGPTHNTTTGFYGQIIADRTWNGTSSSWSAPVVDVTGLTSSIGDGTTEIGGGRPGMANVVETTDGKWMMTFEYWGGGDNVRYKIASNPLDFWQVDGTTGDGISTLAVSTGSSSLAQGGSPVTVRLPDGALLYNAAGSGNVWMNPSGSSTGTWTEYQTTMPAGYSRDLTYDSATGLVLILGNTGTSIIEYANEDFGHSVGTYYHVVNELTGQVIGTSDNTTDANIGNDNVPDVELENAGAVSDTDTQYWHVVTTPNGTVTLTNESGGRAAEIWTGAASAGQEIGQWVDNTADGLWNLIPSSGGYYEFQCASDTSLYLTGSATGAHLTLEPATSNGSQDWQLSG
jgi:Ricin-type beta-trefoil lectin domain-like